MTQNSNLKFCRIQNEYFLWLPTDLFPFFGMWISPDPAGQFANPYSYGGDPLNYIDPTGMWAMGLGLVVGYNKSSGWSVGVGAAADVGDVGVNASLSFNQDGSKSLNTGANLKIPIQTPVVYIEINMGLGFAMNSYSGATLSTHGSVCVGESGNCVGMKQGGSLYFDSSGEPPSSGQNVCFQLLKLGISLPRFSIPRWCAFLHRS